MESPEIIPNVVIRRERTGSVRGTPVEEPQGFQASCDISDLRLTAGRRRREHGSRSKKRYDLVRLIILSEKRNGPFVLLSKSSADSKIWPTGWLT
jgi:hypothetical protein